ncbi:methyl-accepting chemotaxis protein [Bordetella genomosp. 11]|uniref:Chemotaxis protein n=1 Tax=Bordetella genomosp. 11 TaxID=1416808 RepID=A0A261UZP4_9BORD|nr:PAS domain-containing methyl-accepting chemotaxis protein [Bordetella genomosp. 11]OZI66822.1 chemotaxis protein [Bordetella genomosp. 11]
MRVNLPVSDKEYPFPRGRTLVSTTDAKGRILYCNPTFIEVSGFTKEELLGKAHNVIRHPDMPEEAFRDMWATISSGRPWSAPVKNRRKNGDYYWVMANATPMLKDGEAVGYMSVRTEATREQIEEAEALYAVMRDEAQAGRRIHTLANGRRVKRTLAGRVAEMARLGVVGKLTTLLTLLMLCFLAIDRLVPADAAAWEAGAWLLRLLLIAAAWGFLRRSVAAPLDDVLAAAYRLAAGDLTQPLERTRGDELGELQAALGQLRINVGSVVRDARDQSQDIVTGTAEIAQGNAHLSERTETQAGNVQQTAASMEQITGTVGLAAESAQRVSQLSARTSEVAERGARAVEEVGATMQGMLESSRRISEITQVIDSIAFQTNILALNAAVEAARAGEQGRGFAVVAGEVRSLAQRSAHAAKEIRHLIDESGVKVAEGSERTAIARKTMADVLGSVQEVNALIGEITEASKEQLAGISQVNAAVAQLDGITQQNAELVEQVAGAAVSLEGLARTTHETMQVFRLDDGGRLSAAAQQNGDAVTIIKGYPQAHPGALPLKMATQTAAV